MDVRCDGQELIAAAADRVLVYSAIADVLIHSLRGHKDNVLCVQYSKDGADFASGGADNRVIIWDAIGKGKLRYTHDAPIQQVKKKEAIFKGVA